MRIAATAPRNPATEPTDRSMLPITMISSIPRAITRMYPFCRKMFVTFSDLSMTPPVVSWKNTTAISSATSMPDWRTFLPTSARKPPVGSASATGAMGVLSVGVLTAGLPQLRRGRAA